MGVETLSSKVMEKLPTFYCCLVSESMPMCLPRTLLLDASGLHIYCDVEAMLLDLVSLSCPRTS